MGGLKDVMILKRRSGKVIVPYSTAYVLAHFYSTGNSAISCHSDRSENVEIRDKTKPLTLSGGSLSFILYREW